MKKWLVLLGGIAMQSSLGGIYAWSTLVGPLQTQLEFSRFQSGLVYGIMIGIFAFATIPAGRWYLRIGPRRTGMIGAALFTFGYWIASFSQGKFFLFLLGLGLVTGTGIGFGYVCPLSVGMKWFPHRKGLITGIMVAGFGFGALYLSSGMEILLSRYDVLTVIRIVGTTSGGIAFIAASLLSEPIGRKVPHASALFHLKTLVHSTKFLILWMGMFTGTFSGLLISGHLKPLLREYGLLDSLAAFGVPVFALGNTAGRLIWGRWYDHWGPQRTVQRSIGVLLASVMLLLVGRIPVLSFLAVLGIGFGFGSCFVIYASSVADLFGVQNVPRIYPLLFGGYGISALLGPTIGGILSDVTNSYSWGLGLSIVLLSGTLGIVKTLRVLPSSPTH
ncbi:MAG: MFS transporter [Spirochaetes bacterium]|nr:MFS transporter [Spirochaetota bacterium]